MSIDYLSIVSFALNDLTPALKNDFTPSVIAQELLNTGDHLVLIEPRSIPSPENLSITLWYNTSYNGVIPIMTSLLDSSISQVQNAQSSIALPQSSISSLKYYLQANYKVLPTSTVMANIINVIFVVVFCIYVSEGISFMPIYAAVAVARERISQARLQQRLMGVWDILYWATTFLFDLMLSFPPIIIFMIAAYIIVPSLRGAIGAMSVTMFLFSFASLPLCYMLQFLFKTVMGTEKGVSNIIMPTMLLSALVGSLPSFLPALADYMTMIKNILYVIPNYALFDCFLNVGSMYPVYTELLHMEVNPWSWDYCGKAITYMTVVGVILSILVVFIERWYWTKTSKIATAMDNLPASDEDVAAETRRVQEMLGKDAVSVSHIWKVYPGKGKAPAVEACRDVSFGISHGDCFGLLGPNGAGKTSILSILMGTLGYDKGACLVDGNLIPVDIHKAYRQLGYCPQFDVLFDFLTVYECLYFYGSVKGIAGGKLNSVITQVLDALALSEHKDKYTRDLSGGNKRRLCVAIAFMGNPQVVVMDEPSTGLDPVSRRKLWNIIKSSANTRSFLLTTHVMEEADALCNKIAIMVNGEMKCIGSSQHLKSKYGDGYTLDFKLEDNPEYMAKMTELLQSEVGEFETRESHKCHAIVILPTTKPLSALFRLLEEKKEEMHIVDYTLSQCTLDQVFLQFAKAQREERPGMTAEDMLKSSA